MSLTKEMEEILCYLSGKDDYVLFAGFAAFLHTEVESSSDIDIFVSSPEDVCKIAALFLEKGWNRVQCTANDILIMTVKKNYTTLDIVYSKSAQVFLSDKMSVSFKGNTLNVLTPEALLLTKINQIASPERSKEKTERDRKVIYILRQKIDVNRLRELLYNLEDSFWTKGYF